MDLVQFLLETSDGVREDGLRGLQFGLSRVTLKLLQFVDGYWKEGTPVYDDEWDVLVVLDACRYDMLNEVSDEYDFLSHVESRWSRNSVTRLWMESNFTDEYRDEAERTHYVSGNPFSQDKLDEELFSELTEVWRYAWSEPGTVPPRAVTDAAITARRRSNDRVIAHYMQPHCPFIPAPEICNRKDVDRFGAQPEGDVWDRLQRGKVDRDAVWSGYLDNLRLALDEVELLLDNVDAEKVVITSDHGNAVGEWGLYGHVPNVPLTCLRRVPWVETSGTDKRTHSPSDSHRTSDIDREEQLRSLGYV